MKHLGRRCLGGILCTAALIVAPAVCSAHARKGITFAAYVGKVVAQKDRTAPSVERFLVRHLNDSSGLKRASQWETVTFTRPGGFAFSDGITLDSIAFHYSGYGKSFDKGTVSQYVFRFKEGRCVFVRQLAPDFRKFEGYYPIGDPVLDPKGFVKANLHHAVMQGTTTRNAQYMLVVTRSKGKPLVSPCVDSITVYPYAGPREVSPPTKHELQLPDYSHPFPTPRKPQPTGP